MDIKKVWYYKNISNKDLKLFLKYCFQKTEDQLPQDLTGALLVVYSKDSTLYYRDICSS